MSTMLCGVIPHLKGPDAWTALFGSGNLTFDSNPSSQAFRIRPIHLSHPSLPPHPLRQASSSAQAEGRRQSRVFLLTPSDAFC